MTAARKSIESAATNQRFRFDIPYESLVELMKSSFAAEVRGRGKEFVFDADTEKHIRMACKWLTDSRLKPSLLLFGGLGNGKTTMAHTICEVTSALRYSLEDYAKEEKAKYISTLDRSNWSEYIQKSKEVPKTALEAMAMINQFKEPTIVSAQTVADIAGKDADKFAKIETSPFLFIDDLGCEPASIKNYGTDITPVINIIYHRYDTLDPTIVTTNLDKAEIKERYGSRVADRLNEMCESIAYTNKSYRN